MAIAAKNHIPWTNAMLKPDHLALAQLFAMGLLLHAMAFMVPVLVLLIYDQVLGAHSLEPLPMIILGMAMALLAESGYRYFRSRVLYDLISRLDQQTAQRILAHMLGMSPTWWQQVQATQNLPKAWKAVESLSRFIHGNGMLVLIELPAFLLLFPLLFLLIGMAAWWAVAGAVLTWALAAGITQCMASKHSAGKEDNQSDRRGWHETLEHLSAIQSSRSEEAWLHHQMHQIQNSVQAQYGQKKQQIMMEIIAQTMMLMAAAMVLLTGVYMVWHGTLTGGVLVAGMIVMWRLMNLVQTTAEWLPSALGAYRNLAYLRHFQTSLTETNRVEESITQPPLLMGAVEIRQIAWRGNSPNAVFFGLNLSLNPGQMLAITGESGGGKTTLLRMLNGLEKPDAGEIFHDGIQIQRYEPRQLRHSIGWFGQYPEFLPGSIEYNLMLANPEAKPHDLRAALERAFIWKEVQQLPQQLASDVSLLRVQGNHGLLLRLALARFYLRARPLMLCDELPHALMNTEVGDAWLDYLKSLKGKSTLIVVSSRDEVLREADQLLCLRYANQPWVGKPLQFLTEQHPGGLHAI